MSKIKSYIWDNIEQSEAYYLDSKEPTKVVSQKGLGRPLEGPARWVKSKGKGCSTIRVTTALRGFKGE